MELPGVVTDRTSELIPLEPPEITEGIVGELTPLELPEEAMARPIARTLLEPPEITEGIVGELTPLELPEEAMAQVAVLTPLVFFAAIKK